MVNVAVEFEDEQTRVRRWRQECLEAAGFGEFTAFRLAMRLDVDYRKAIDMLRGGASEAQVTDLLIDD